MWPSAVKAFLVFMTLATPFSAGAQTNLALNKTVMVSSLQDTSYHASDAVDGNVDTRWSSAWSDPQWIYVDLGSKQAFNMVNLIWEAAYATGYDIQIANDTTHWTTVYSTGTSTGGNEQVDFPDTSARYVRMYGRTRATGFGYSLWEFGVYKMPSYGKNLALHKPVHASSQWLDYDSSNAVDGNSTTEWMSGWADTNWIYVDLDSVQGVDIVVILWGTNFAPTYLIQVSSDASNWTDVYTATADSGHRSDCGFTGVRARYVRLLETSKSAIGGIDVCEFKVFCRTPVKVIPRRHEPAAKAQGAHAAGRSFIVGGWMLTFPPEFANRSKQVSVFDVNGRLVRRGTVTEESINIYRYFGLSKGLYMVKVAPAR